MSHVFISYRHDDGDFAEILKNRIEEAGFVTWIDEEKLRAGENWRETIDKAIRNAFALIVVMTPTAKESEYVTYEWAFAWGVGVKVIPVLLKSTPLHPRLEAFQYLDFTSRNARPWNKLIEVLREVKEVTEHNEHNTVRVSRDTPTVIQKAIDALDSLEPEKRKEAVKTLSQSSHPAAREALVGSIQHPLPDVRITAVYALGYIGDAAIVPELINALGDADKDMIIAIIHTLGDIGNSTAVLELLNFLHHEDEYLRRIAVGELGKIGDVTIIPKLINALLDEDLEVCRAAAEALKSIATPEALEAVEAWERRHGNNKIYG